MRQQRGGAFIGFIIGVVVGLGAALAVAVYVTKVPVPFSNRTSGNTAEKEAAEDKKNKNWDPNSSLYGKTPVRPPAPVASGPVGPPGGPMVAPAVVGRPAAPASAAAKSDSKADTKPAPSSDPLGDLAKARSASPTVDPFSYFVQAGAFRTPEDAEAQRVKLSLMGIETKVTEREQSGRTVFRVRAGPFNRKDDADKLKERLDGGGMESALVRVQR